MRVRHTRTLQKSFKIPAAKYRGSKPEFEGFSIQLVSGKAIAVWAERAWNHGEFTAQMWWSTFDAATNSFGMMISGPVPVEVPLEGKCNVISLILKSLATAEFTLVRLLTVTTLTNRRSSQRAFEIGRFNMGKDNVFEYSPTGTLKIFDGSREWKIEALEFMPPAPGHFIFGSHDELDGGRIFVQW